MHPRKLIIVLDDNISVLLGVRRLLKAHGFQVETFAAIDSFMDGADLARATCLVLDINLNGMSGINLKRRLTEKGIAVPVIFMTGCDNDSTRQAALNAGCFDYLLKPFSSRLLIEALERLPKVH